MTRPRIRAAAETLDDIRKRFGDAVAEIVADCTDALTEPKGVYDLDSGEPSLSLRAMNEKTLSHD
jgi:hypothetical protein